MVTKRQPDFFTVAQLTRRTGLTRAAFSWAIINGKLSGAHRIDGRWVIPATAFEVWWARHQARSRRNGAQ